MNHKAKKMHFPYTPYIVSVVILLYALILPMYRWIDYFICFFFALIAYFFTYSLFPPVIKKEEKVVQEDVYATEIRNQLEHKINEYDK